jgi:hypothetical protein
MKKLILLIATLLTIGMPSCIFAQEKPLLVKKFSKQQYERIFSGAYLSGAVNAQITFIEVMDPECPFCFSQHQSGILQKFAQRKDVNFMSV